LLQLLPCSHAHVASCLVVAYGCLWVRCALERVHAAGKDGFAVPVRRLLTTHLYTTRAQPRPSPSGRGAAAWDGPPRGLADVLKCGDALFLDLLAGCFAWDPAARLTPEQALQHPWILDHSPSPTHRCDALQCCTLSGVVASNVCLLHVLTALQDTLLLHRTLSRRAAPADCPEV
jgi:hypothetical protein